MSSVSTTPSRTGPARQADRLYHDLLSNTETRRERARAREFSDCVVAAAAGRIAAGDEVTDGFPRDVFEAMAGQRLFEIPFPADVGGAGLARPASATAAVVEELAYHSNSVAAIFDVHCSGSGG